MKKIAAVAMDATNSEPLRIAALAAIIGKKAGDECQAVGLSPVCAMPALCLAVKGHVVAAMVRAFSQGDDAGDEIMRLVDLHMAGLPKVVQVVREGHKAGHRDDDLVRYASTADLI